MLPGAGELLHARRQMRGLADGRVVHVQVVANGPHHDLPGVEPDAHPQRQTVGAAHVVGIAPHRRLHGQGGIAGAQGVVFVGDGGTKQRHNAIAQHLVDGALEAVHRVHHAMQGRIEELLGRFGIEARDQLRRALEVGKQHGDLLALAFQGTAGGEDFLGEIGRGVGERGRGRHGRHGWRRGRGSLTGPDQHRPIAHRLARRWPSMSSTVRSSSAASSSWNCRLRVR